jgi:hypothetical protein
MLQIHVIKAAHRRMAAFQPIKKENLMAKKRAAKKKKKSTIETVREVAQAIFPRAKIRQTRRKKRRAGVKKALGIKSKK